MIDTLNEIHRLSRNCLAMREHLILLETKRTLWINKSEEISLAFVGDEEDGVTIPIGNGMIIKEIEVRRDKVKAEYAEEKAKLIEILETFKEYENN